MVSIEMFRAIADEREREIQRELRVRDLLRGADREPETHPASAYGLPGRSGERWRARTPRASATTR